MNTGWEIFSSQYLRLEFKEGVENEENENFVFSTGYGCCACNGHFTCIGFAICSARAFPLHA
jgi:hypothetical protein